MSNAIAMIGGEPYPKHKGIGTWETATKGVRRPSSKAELTEIQEQKSRIVVPILL
jgi:hypothetical protein